MQSQARTVEQYLDELPPERRETVAAVRDVILENLPDGYEEGMGYGMIGYVAPHLMFACVERFLELYEAGVRRSGRRRRSASRKR